MLDFAKSSARCGTDNVRNATILDMHVGDKLIKMRTGQRPDVREGDEIKLAFAAEAVHLFDPASGLRRAP